MDVQLKELLEKINNEGIRTADDKAADIIKNAEKKAAEIVSTAKKEADKIVSDAKVDAAKAEAGGKAAITQAGRDLLLKIKAEIEGLFRSIIDAEVASALSGKPLEEAVAVIVKSWAEKGDYVVQLSEKDFNELEKSLISKLSAEIKNGVEIKPFSGVESGFRLSEKDGSSYFNFTTEAVSENIAELLNPKLAEIVQEAAKE